MHDIERKPTQDDATVKITDLEQQKDQQMAPVQCARYKWRNGLCWDG